MAKPKEWLGSFIENELREAIAWKQDVKKVPKVKEDPETRFSDDGSNFRSAIQGSDLPESPHVQVAKVILKSDAVTIVITDGFTSVRARLSQAALATLEAEIEDKIDLETIGDLFAIREATVIGTPYGPSDEHVEVAINDIEYLYHLRKPVGKPQPIEERREVQHLIEEITELRRQQYAGADEAHRLSPDPLSVDAGPGAAQDKDTPKSQRSVSRFRSSPNTQQSPNTQPAVATQLPVSRKARGPSLSKDGFEIAGGANLDRPMQAGFTTSTRRLSSSSVKKPVVTDANSARLLSLLGKRKAEEALPPRAPPPAPSASPPATEHSPRSDPAPAPKGRKEILRDAPLSHSPAAKHSAMPSSAPIAEKPRSLQITTVETSDPASKPKATPQQNSSSNPPPREYSRKRIPRDQLNLLDQASSWLPSLPGRQFPHPNVPIELLTQWNAHVAAGDKTIASAKPTSADEVEQPAEHTTIEQNNTTVISSDSSSSESLSEDEEEFGESQWPPSQPPSSPAQKKPMLPPDSTMGTSAGPSPGRRRWQLPPDSSDETSAKRKPVENGQPAAGIPPNISNRNTPRPVSHQSQNAVEDSPRRLNGSSQKPPSSHQSEPSPRADSDKSSSRTPHPLPDKPHWITPRRQVSGGGGFTRSQQAQRALSHLNSQTHGLSPSQKPSNQGQIGVGQRGSPQFSPLSLQQGRQESLPVRSNPSTPKDSRRSELKSNVPTDSTPTTEPPKEMPIRATPASVVKATQIEQPDDNDEMEMSVPRSLGQDPAVAHRKRRSDHFKLAQREDWIKQTYVPDSMTRTLNFGKIYTAYKSSHTHDTDIRPSEFSQAIRAVFPALYDSDGEPLSGLRLKSAEENLYSPLSLQRERTALADTLDGAVETPVNGDDGGRSVSREPDPVDVVTNNHPTGQLEDRKRKRSSLFAEFAVPKSSNSDQVQQSTPGSGRRLPWAATSAQAEKKSGRGSFQAVVGGHEAIATPTKPPVERWKTQNPARNGQELQEKIPNGTGNDYAATEDPVRPNATRRKDGPRLAVEGGHESKTKKDAAAPVSVFAEFAQAWKRLRPGGAFAGQRAETNVSERRQLNVLAWDP